MKHVITWCVVLLMASSISEAQTLIGSWPFNGNMNDVSGNNLNGFGSATLTAGRNGIPNTAYRVDSIRSFGIGTSSSNTTQIQFNGLFDLTTWTLGVVLKVDSFRNSDCQTQYLIGAGSEHQSNSYALGFTDNFFDNDCNIYSPKKVKFCSQAAGYTNSLPSPSNYHIIPDAWYYVVSTYDGQFIRQYVNGIMVDSQSWRNQYNYLTLSWPPIEFGSFFEQPIRRYFTGIFDSIAIWSGVLSPDTIYHNFIRSNPLTISQPFTDTVFCFPSVANPTELKYQVNISGFFQQGNVFTAQLSDSNGSFSNPINIGAITATTSGQIPYVIPSSTSKGTGYRIRVIASDPQYISLDDQYDISVGHIGPDSLIMTVSPGDTICSGTPVTFNATLFSNALYISFLWEKNGVMVGANSDTYTDSTWVNGSLIHCRSAAGYGCLTHVRDKFVRITVDTVINLNIGISTNAVSHICAQTPVTFTTNVINGGASPTYQWMKNGRVVQGAVAASYTDTTLLPGDIITCAGTGSLPCSVPAVSNVIALTIYPRPDTTVVASGPIHVCSTDSVTLHAPNGSTYQWQLNGGNIPGATTPDYTVHSSGGYTVYVVNNFGCYTTSTTIAATVSPAPIASISNISRYLKICSNDSVILAPTFGSNANYTYQWMRNGTNIHGANSAQYAATTAGDYSAIVSNNGCLRTSNVLTTTTVAAPTDSLLKYGQTVLCPGVVGVQLSADTTIGQPQHYLWLMNNIPITGATAATYFATIPTTYTLKITDTVTGCSIVTRPVNVVRTSGPAPVISYHYPRLTTGIFNSYQWYMNGSVLSTGTSATWQPTQSGAYEVWVTDSNGCTGTSANFYFTYSGVQSVTKEDVKIYPNPANDVVYIDAPVAVNALVYSMDGRTIFNAKEIKMIDISTWASGVYLIKILDGSSVVRIDKLIKN